MRVEEVAIIRGIPLFYGMSGEHLDAVLQGSCLKQFSPRVQIIKKVTLRIFSILSLKVLLRCSPV